MTRQGIFKLRHGTIKAHLSHTQGTPNNRSPHSVLCSLQHIFRLLQYFNISQAKIQYIISPYGFCFTIRTDTAYSIFALQKVYKNGCTSKLRHLGLDKLYELHSFCDINTRTQLAVDLIITIYISILLFICIFFIFCFSICFRKCTNIAKKQILNRSNETFYAVHWHTTLAMTCADWIYNNILYTSHCIL